MSRDLRGGRNWGFVGETKAVQRRQSPDHYSRGEVVGIWFCSPGLFSLKFERAGVLRHCSSPASLPCSA